MKLDLKEVLSLANQKYAKAKRAQGGFPTVDYRIQSDQVLSAIEAIVELINRGEPVSTDGIPRPKHQFNPDQLRCLKCNEVYTNDLQVCPSCDWPQTNYK
jgi:rubrerythrin